MRAASSSSSGIVSMYWRNRNTPVGVAAPGQITPQGLLSRPSSETTRKVGTSTIVGGIIRVAMISTNTVVRPRKSYFDSANAAIELMISMMIVATPVMNTLFHR